MIILICNINIINVKILLIIMCINNEIMCVCNNNINV